MNLHTVIIILASLLLSLSSQANQSEQSDLPQESDKETQEITEEDRQFENRDLSGYGEGGVPEGIVQLGAGSNYFSPYIFMVDKGARVLSIWEATLNGINKVSAYTIDIGKNVSDKRILGDKATPEGVYFMLEKYEASALDYKLYGSRAFTLDYPNFFDKREQKTGSGIWIHAVPDSVSLRRGSRGCVVVRDEIIKTLHPYFKSGFTPVIIKDEINMLSKERAERQRKEINQLIENWRVAWTSKDLNNYMQYYHSDFRSLGMNKSKWRTYKKNLNKQYDSITVQLSTPVIYQHKDELVVRFIQNYSSDRYRDIGEKTLYFKRENGSYKIVGEQWRKDQSRLALEELTGRSTVSICQNDSGCGPQSAYSN